MDLSKHTLIGRSTVSFLISAACGRGVISAGFRKLSDNTLNQLDNLAQDYPGLMLIVPFQAINDLKDIAVNTRVIIFSSETAGSEITNTKSAEFRQLEDFVSSVRHRDITVMVASTDWAWLNSQNKSLRISRFVGDIYGWDMNYQIVPDSNCQIWCEPVLPHDYGYDQVLICALELQAFANRLEFDSDCKITPEEVVEIIEILPRPKLIGFHSLFPACSRVDTKWLVPRLEHLISSLKDHAERTCFSVSSFLPYLESFYEQQKNRLAD